MTYKETSYTWSESATVQIEEYNPRKIFSSLTLSILLTEDDVNLQVRTLMDKVRFLVREDMDAQIDSLMALRDEPLKDFVEETGAVKTVDLGKPAEEQPPLPQEDAAPEPASKEFVKYEAEQGKDYKSFEVKRLEVALTNSEDKYLKVYGWPTQGKKDWVACWQQVAEDLFAGGILDMDLGFYEPPFPIRATVVMTEYKGKPSPGVVVGWERTS